MGYSEASPLSDALVDHHLAKKAWGASGGQFGGRGAPLPSHHTWHFGRLQLQVHVLLERPDARVHLDAQLVGRHLREQARLSFLFFKILALFCPNPVTSAGPEQLILFLSRHEELYRQIEATSNASIRRGEGQLTHTFLLFVSPLCFSILPPFPSSSRV